MERVLEAPSKPGQGVHQRGAAVRARQRGTAGIVPVVRTEARRVYACGTASEVEA